MVERRPEEEHLARCQRLAVCYAWSERHAHLELTSLPRECWTDWAAQEGLRALQSLARAGEELDMLHVAKWLKTHGQEQAWRMLEATEAECHGIIPQPIFQQALREIREAGQRRRLRLVGQQIVRLAESDEGSSEEATRRALQEVSQLCTVSAARTRTELEVMEALQAQLEFGEADAGVCDTGLELLDKHTGGLRAQQVVLIAARPKMGKTCFALQLARHIASTKGPVYFESLEMSAEELVGRSIRQVLQLPELTPERCARAKSKAVDLTIFDGEGSLPGFEARVAYQMLHKPDTVAVFVDYLGLLQGHKRDPYSEASLVSRTLVRVAKRHKVLLVALHQLNRDLEKRADKRPQLSDLRDSGQIEQDAHKIFFLHRPWVYDRGSANESDPAEVHVVLAANRSGETGTVKVRWNGPTQTFFQAGSAPRAEDEGTPEQLELMLV